MAEIGHPASKYRVTATFVNGKVKTFYCEDFGRDYGGDISLECLCLKIDESKTVVVSYHNLLYVDIREQTDEERERALEIYRGVEVD